MYWFPMICIMKMSTVHKISYVLIDYIPDCNSPVVVVGIHHNSGPAVVQVS